MNYRVIQLTRDIKNPSPDRRSKDWHKLPVIKAGSRFLINDRGPDDYGTMQSSEARYAWIATHDPLAKLIMENSVSASPDTVRELKVVANCDWGSDTILRILLKLGRICPADFYEVGRVPEDF